jgi:hypothetical protein
MSPSPPISRTDFENLLSQHRQLIELANDLEYQMYRLGELPPEGRVSDCQQAGGSLVGLLRDYLFRIDQQVFPQVDSSTSVESERS